MPTPMTHQTEDIGIIRLEKVNEVFMRIHAEPSTRMELYEYFSHFAPNYRYAPKFKAKVWDGKIGLYKLGPSLIYSGLLEDVIRFANEFGYTVKGTEQFIPKRNPERTKSLIKEVQSIRIDKKGFQLRDYQLASVVSSIELKRQVVVSATGSGKSAIIFLLVQWYLRQDPDAFPVLIVVPTLSLISQMRADFLDYDSTLDPDIIHCIYGGQDKNPNKKTKIIISTWQSIYTLPSEWFDHVQMVIIDECVAKGTKILTPKGERNIEDLLPGDKIINYDEEKRVFKEDEIVKLHKNLSFSETYPMLKITLENGKSIELTGNHKLLTNRGWVMAMNLTEEDEIISFP